MSVLGFFSMVFTISCIIRTILLLVRRRNLGCGLYTRIVMVIAIAPWVAGTVYYMVVYMQVKEDALRIEIKEGFAMGIVVAVLQICHFVVGNIFVSELTR